MDEPLALQNGANTYFYLADGLGSIQRLVKKNITPSSATTENHTNTEWGDSGFFSSIGNRFGFTGREYDSESGLYYYRARYYDPQQGRFISEDPLGFRSGTSNFYAYVGNDPATLTDPHGLKTEVCCRPLRRFTGRLGFNHCYVLITSEDDQLQFNTYGLHREDEHDNPFPGGAEPVINDKTDAGGTCANVSDATPCKERDFVSKAMSSKNCPSCGKLFPFGGYWPFNTNSNFWVWDSLKKAGMTPPKFSGGNWAPGYSEGSDSSDIAVQKN